MPASGAPRFPGLSFSMPLSVLHIRLRAQPNHMLVMIPFPPCIPTAFRSFAAFKNLKTLPILSSSTRFVVTSRAKTRGERSPLARRVQPPGVAAGRRGTAARSSTSAAACAQRGKAYGTHYSMSLLVNPSAAPATSTTWGGGRTDAAVFLPRSKSAAERVRRRDGRSPAILQGMGYV